LRSRRVGSHCVSETGREAGQLTRIGDHLAPPSVEPPDAQAVGSTIMALSSGAQ
jgi:hypothetical protein